MMDTTDGGWMGSDGWVHYDNTPTVRDNFLTADIQQQLDGMASWGVNCIQFYLTMQYWIQDTAGYRNNLKYCIEQCSARGIYVVVTWWRVSTSTVEVYGTLPYPPYSQGNANDTALIGSAQDFINFQAAVANELKGYSNVIFEFWNEPTGAIGSAQANSWFDTVQRSITAIRATGATNLINNQFDGPVWDFKYHYRVGWEWIMNYTLTDPSGNLVYDMHVYREMGYNVNNTAGNTMHTMDEVMTWFTNTGGQLAASTYNKPMLVGEAGCNMWKNEEGGNQTEEYEYFGNLLTILDQYGISYCIFAGPPWAYPSPASKWALVYYNQPNYQPTVAGQILKQHLASAPLP
jgi:hypothetical protein